MAKYTDVAAAPLSDGRIQFWSVDGSGQLWSSWKKTIDPNAGWTPLSKFQMPSGVTAVTAIAAAPLPDKRLQLWTIDSNGGMWSCWKTTTSSNAAWTPWSGFNPS